MSKITAPLLSFTAAGQIAKTQVYASWKGRPYVRRYVTPANPNSTGQAMTRNAFAFLSNVYKVAPSIFQAPWQAYAKGKVMTDRNAFFSKNVSLLRDASDLDAMIFSPGANGGLVGTVTTTAGNDLVTIAGTPPDPLPAGWSVVGLYGAALLSQDPQSPTDFNVKTGSDLTDPYSFTIALANTTTYATAGWFVYQRSALATDLAYGPATADLTLTT